MAPQGSGPATVAAVNEVRADQLVQQTGFDRSLTRAPRQLHRSGGDPRP
jgi:hypothetical protein